MLVALGLVFGGLMLLGLGKYTKPRVIMETYLNESVQGLEVGSPVKHRGVKVGEVSQIDFVFNAYTTSHRYVLVRISAPLENTIQNLNGDLSEAMALEIQEGLRVRLASQGLTGTAYLESDFLDAKRFPLLPIDWTPEYLYVPSAPSRVTLLVDALEKIFTQLEDARLQDIVVNLNELVTNLNLLVVADIAPAMRNIETLTSSMSSNVNALSQQVGGVVEDEVRPLLEDVRKTTARLPATISRLDGVVRDAGHLVKEERDTLAETFENINQASRDLKELGADAKRNPARLLFGAPPPPSIPP